MIVHLRFGFVCRAFFRPKIRLRHRVSWPEAPENDLVERPAGPNNVPGRDYAHVHRNFVGFFTGAPAGEGVRELCAFRVPLLFPARNAQNRRALRPDADSDERARCGEPGPADGGTSLRWSGI